jgi:hypothetical protein
MNERIMELAEQAGFKTNWQHDDIRELKAKRYEEFARLIIQECTSLTLDHKNDDYYNGWLDYRDSIRQHFGVKP